MGTGPFVVGSVSATRPVGFALVRDAEILGAEPFIHELITGVERTLSRSGVPLLLQVVPTVERATSCIGRWADSQLVSGTLLIDLQPDDERVELVERLSLPSVVIGDPVTAGGLSSVWTQDDIAMTDVVDLLVDLGHQHLGHVSGPSAMSHTRIRRAAFLAAAANRSLTTSVFDGDYSMIAGEQAIDAFHLLGSMPTAVVFDNDLMALGALARARTSGFSVPDELSIVAWDDSSLCQLSQPTLSAVAHDVQGLGEVVGEALLDALAGNSVRHLTTAPARLLVRESVAVVRV